MFCCMIDFFLLLYAVYRGEYGNTWPLPPEVRRFITTSILNIVKLLNRGDDLIEAVISEDCFRRMQLESVQGTPVERSTKLLDKIKRSSIATLNCFLRCLAVKRPNVVPLLNVTGKDFLNNADFT